MSVHPQQDASTKVTQVWAGKLRATMQKLIEDGASMEYQRQQIMDVFLDGVSNTVVTIHDIARMQSIIKTTLSLIVSTKKLTSKSKLRKPSSANLTSQLPTETAAGVRQKLLPPPTTEDEKEVF